MISAVAGEGSLKLMACEAQLLAQICCSHLLRPAGYKCSHVNRSLKKQKEEEEKFKVAACVSARSR